MGFIKSFGVAIFGLISSILTAIIISVFAKLTGINIFTMMIWFVIPAGAIAAGMVSASGYYYGCLYFHKKPGWILFLQMVIIAGFTQFLIYYIGYVTLVLDDGRKVADYIQFNEYLDYILTKSHYRVGRGYRDSGEVGSMGYTVAVVQFVGFLIGGAGLFAIIRGKNTCPNCDLYLRPLADKNRVFYDTSLASAYYDGLTQHDIGSPEFIRLIKQTSFAKAEKGSTIIISKLLGCPKCKKQLIEEEVSIFDGKEFNKINKFDRVINIPDGIDLLGSFKTQ